MDWNEVRDDAMFVHVDAAWNSMADAAAGGEDPRSAEVLELHYFGGLTGEQIAEMLSLNRRTIFARSGVRQSLHQGPVAGAMMRELWLTAEPST